MTPPRQKLDADYCEINGSMETGIDNVRKNIETFCGHLDTKLYGFEIDWRVASGATSE